MEKEKKVGKKIKNKNKQKSVKRKLDIKRPQTAYFIFCSKQRELAKKNISNEKLNAKQLGIMWKKLSDIQKEPYIEQYKEEKKKYDLLKQELQKKNEDDSDEEEEEKEEKKEKPKEKQKSKNKKSNVKTKKSQVINNNKKVCNRGKYDYCKKNKLKIKNINDEDDDFDLEDKEEIQKNAKNLKIK